MPFFARALPIFALALALAVVGCEDSTLQRATLANLSDTVEVYAINGAPAGARTAMQFFQASAVQANAGFQFDVALDLDASGKVVVIPVRRLAGFGGGHRVGLQALNDGYDSLRVAPRGGYVHDSTLVVNAGRTVVVESADPNACALSFFSQVFYAKFVVSQVDLANRRMTVMFTVDRNCGFRSFAKGIPDRPDR